MNACNTITLNGRQVTVGHQTLPIDALRLDIANPRLATLLEQRKLDSTQENLAMLLTELRTTSGLKDAIAANGGLTEPLIVTPNSDGGYTVIEGNTRLVCLRALGFSEAPTNIILSEDFSDQEKSALLSGMHVRHKRAWSMFDRARFLYKMVHDQGRSRSSVAIALAISPQNLDFILLSVERTRAFVENSTSKMSEYEAFGYFRAFFNDKYLAKRAQKDPFYLEQFGKWLDEGKFGSMKEVRFLRTIMTSKTGTQEFLNSNAATAYHMVKRKDPDAAIATLKRSNKLRETLVELPDRDWLAMSENPRAAERNLKRLNKAIDGILRKLSALAGDEEDGGVGTEEAA